MNTVAEGPSPYNSPGLPWPDSKGDAGQIIQDSLSSELKGRAPDPLDACSAEAALFPSNVLCSRTQLRRIRTAYAVERY